MSRGRVFFSRGGITCPRCQRELETTQWWEKLRVLPYLLIATIAMEALREKLPGIVRLIVILGPPALLLPYLMSLKEKTDRR